MVLVSTNVASLENEDSPSGTRGGKSLLGTFPFNSESVDDLNDHGHQNHNQDQDNIAPALPASQDLGAREAKQARTVAHRKILRKLWIMSKFSGFEQSARQLCWGGWSETKQKRTKMHRQGDKGSLIVNKVLTEILMTSFVFKTTKMYISRLLLSLFYLTHCLGGDGWGNWVWRRSTVWPFLWQEVKTDQNKAYL